MHNCVECWLSSDALEDGFNAKQELVSEAVSPGLVPLKGASKVVFCLFSDEQVELHLLA